MVSFTFDVLTLFPLFFSQILCQSILGRSIKCGIIKVNTHDIWDHSIQNKVDGRPFGGGPGMVMRVDVLYKALQSVLGLYPNEKPHIILLSPQGRPLQQKIVKELVTKKHLILICGRYGGVDARILHWINEEISIGDYVLSGGEIPSLVMIDAISRLVPHVVQKSSSVENDSFSHDMLDSPHYTRPQNFLNMEVPAVLRSGHRKKIENWRMKKSLLNTVYKRPDLIQGLTR